MTGRESGGWPDLSRLSCFPMGGSLLSCLHPLSYHRTGAGAATRFTSAQNQRRSGHPRGLGYTLFLTADEAVLSLGRPAEPADPLGDLVPLISTSPAGDGTRAVLRMRLVGARPDPETRGLEPLPGRSHYLTGRDAAEWRTEVPRYAKVEYLTVYPGIDLLYYGNQGALEYDFIVSPGADPAAIVLGFEGADPLEINSQGNLLLRTAAGEIRGFEIGAYDPSRPLVIDPRKVYSTYLGGSLHDEVLGIAVDPNDSSAYVTGIAWSADFPTVSPIQGSNGGSYDAFVAKINAAGSALVFSTYLGGNAWDRGQAITWDDDWGEIVVAGTTYSSNFPTQNPLQGSLSGPADAFMTRLKSDGSAIQYSTYLGGSAWDGGGGGGGIWSYGGKMATAGMTYSTDFPTANPSQASNAGGMDAFVTYFKDDGTLDWSTYLGGSDRDAGLAVTDDPGGKILVTGTTLSTDFPTVAPIQGTNAGSYDAFVVKRDSGVLSSTYLGGSGSDVAYGVATDTNESVYVTGETTSTDFPTASPYQAANAGGVDVFVTKINKDMNALVYSTYLGGSANDFAAEVTVPDTENAMVVGMTTSSDFPTVPGLAAIGGGVDAFVTRFNNAGSGLAYSSFLGGSGVDRGAAISHDSGGDAYVGGMTSSTDFPTASPLQVSNAGGMDGFVTKVTVDPADDLNDFL